MLTIRPSALVLTLAAALILVACGPVYQTRYTYEPPPEMAGKQCVTQCASIREMCRSSAENRAAQERAVCQQSAMLRYAACIATAHSDTARNACSSSTSCNTQAHTEHCETDYNRCYQDCGGRGTAETVCVSGCEG